jgi:hypothetical protein|tara:strand:+ start:26 stop:253 length:228 start_codon:yes stop_codon:yes gene_type:complete
MNNPILKEKVKKENPMKEWLITYVGNKLTPDNDEITVEMIIDVMSEEFPEFLLALAEENFIRGYQQAVVDFESVN